MRQVVSSGFRAHFLFGKRMSRETVNEKIRKIAENAAENNDLELVHAEVSGVKKNLAVRIFIDKESGVTHEDCAKVSREVGAVLDEDELIESEYLLEVSSPGLERGLYSLKDFEKFAGNLARIKTYMTIDGQKNYRGSIIGVDGEEIIFEDNTNGEVRIPFEAVAKANIEIDIEKKLKEKKAEDK